MAETRAWEQRYAELEAMVADVCASMKQTNRACGSDHFKKSGEYRRFGEDDEEYSSHISDSSGFNRPDPKPIYEIKAEKEIPKASPMPIRRYKLQKRISCEELDERMMKGLCVFCEEPETPGHYLQHMDSGILMIDSEDYLSDSMVNKIGNEISSDRWLSNSIGCELEIGGTDNDEDRVPSDSDLLVNDIDEVKKDLVAIDVDSETDLLTENYQQFQEQASNRFTNSVLQPSLVPQLCSLLKEQVQEAQEENSRVQNHKNWVQHVLLEEDSSIHLPEPVSKSENLRQMTSVNSRETVMGVVEKIQQVTSVTNKISTLQRQLFGKKFKDKERLKWKKRSKSLKSWRFKFKSKRHGRSEVSLDMTYETQHTKFLKKSTAGWCKQVYASFYVWLMLNSFVVQQVMRDKKIRLSKRWWFKYRFDKEDQAKLQSRTGYSLSRREILTLIFQAKALVLVLLLFGDERFQIKHKWRFNLLLSILELELYLDSLVLITSYAHQFDNISLIILMRVELSVFFSTKPDGFFFSTNLEVKVSLKEEDVIQVKRRKKNGTCGT